MYSLLFEVSVLLTEREELKRLVARAFKMEAFRSGQEMVF